MALQASGINFRRAAIEQIQGGQIASPPEGGESTEYLGQLLGGNPFGDGKIESLPILQPAGGVTPRSVEGTESVGYALGGGNIGEATPPEGVGQKFDSNNLSFGSGAGFEKWMQAANGQSTNPQQPASNEDPAAMIAAGKANLQKAAEIFGQNEQGGQLASWAAGADEMLRKFKTA